MRIAKIKVDPKIVSSKPSDGLRWRTRFDFAVSENGKVGLYSSKTKKVVEIDTCSIALNKINNSDIFSKKWNGSDRVRVAVSSSDQLNISRGKKTIDGPKKIREVVGDNFYDISPQSFWQSHTQAPSILSDLVVDFMKLKPGDIVCDLYGGVGLFTMPISKKIGNDGHVHLVEISSHSVRDAYKIFKDYTNVSIHRGNVDRKLPKINNIDIIVLDPPRTGAGKEVVNQIISKQPRAVVYISCDPASLARDAKYLKDSDYELDKINAIDLFPMTHHIESIVRFIPKKKN